MQGSLLGGLFVLAGSSAFKGCSESVPDPGLHTQLERNRHEQLAARWQAEADRFEMQIHPEKKQPLRHTFVDVTYAEAVEPNGWLALHSDGSIAISGEVAFSQLFVSGEVTVTVHKHAVLATDVQAPIMHISSAGWKLSAPAAAADFQGMQLASGISLTDPRDWEHARGFSGRVWQSRDIIASPGLSVGKTPSISAAEPDRSNYCWTPNVMSPDKQRVSALLLQSGIPFKSANHTPLHQKVLANAPKVPVKSGRNLGYSTTPLSHKIR